MRFYQYVPVLHASDIEVQVAPLLNDNYLRRQYGKQATNWFEVFGNYMLQAIRLLGSRKFDLLWIEKELFPNFPAWFEQALSALGVRYIVDYDDAVFHNHLINPHPAKRLLIDKIDKVMRNSALVVCGNAYLAEYARSAGARRVEIVPTVIDLDRYEVSTPAMRKEIVVGWIGSPSTARYLHTVAAAIKELAEEFPIRLRVIGAQFASPDLSVECRPWSEKTEVSEVQDFDIGIMPLKDSPWERGKCGYKLIQYMACGKPVIASAVGINIEIVSHDLNGYLASSHDEWVSALRALCVDRDARQEMGKQGRLAVEQRYCLQVTYPRMAQLFGEVVPQDVV